MMDKKKKLYEELKKLTDIRVDKHKIKYQIEQITFMIFFANLQGANTLEDIHTWMICNTKNKYLLKIFKTKVIKTIEELKAPTETTKFNSRERGKSVESTIEVFTNNSCNIVVYDQDKKNIQSVIKVTKRSQHTEKPIIYYYVGNFQSNIDLFFTNIIEHWKVETYHYNLDKKTKED
jgi:hypothetical protein